MTTEDFIAAKNQKLIKKIQKRIDESDVEK